MSRLPGFVGPFNRTRSVNFDVEDTINLYVERRDAGTPKTEGNLLDRPGLSPFVYLTNGPVRALFAQDGRCFAVSGNGFHEIFANQTMITRGTVSADTNPATIHSNGIAGGQLFIVSGMLGYIFDLTTNTLTQITDVDFPFPAVRGVYVDSYFIAMEAYNLRFHISALLDGDDWNGLDVASVSESSDNKIAMAVSHRELWLFGTKNTEVWVNTGAANFPFAPIPGVFIEHGIAAPWSVVSVDNTLVWLGADELGNGVVWRANGYTPARVSTFAVEDYIRRLSRIDDAIAFAFQMGGHTFYVLYLPQADTTLVYDISNGEWMRWAIWNPDLGHWEPWIPRCHCFGFGKHLMGDRRSAMVYESALDILTDAVVP
jgi:hypothetical protein